MKHRWKRLLSLVLVLVTAASMMPTIYAKEPELLLLTIQYYIEGEDTMISAPYEAQMQAGSTYSVPSPQVDLYVLADGEPETVSGRLTEDTTIRVDYVYQEQEAEYTINYVGLNLDGSKKEDLDKVTGTASVGSVISAEDKTFDNYLREPCDMNLQVTADGKAELTVPYIMKQNPCIVFNTGGSYVAPITSPAGTDITELVDGVGEPTRPGYTFAGWDVNGDGVHNAEDVLPHKMPEEDMEVTALWGPGTASYTVQYYFENVNDENYTWDKTLNKTRTATTGSTATVTQSDKDLADEQIAIANGTYDVFQQGEFYGFDYSHCEDCEVAADGSSVLKLYYDREIWTICLMDNLVGTHVYDRPYLTGLDEFNGWEKKVWKEFSGKFGSSVPADFPTNDEFIAQAMELKESADEKYHRSDLKYAGHTQVYVSSSGHGGTFDDDDELRHASWCSFGYFDTEDKDKPGSHTLHAYPALSEGSYNYYITWKGEKLGVHGTVPEDFETVHTRIAGPSSSSIGPGLIADAIGGFTYVGGEMQSYSESDKCRTTGILYAPPTTGFLGDFHGPGCTCGNYLKVEEEENWDSELQAFRLDTDAHLDLSTGGTKRLKVGQYTTYFMRREQYDVKFVSLAGGDEEVLRTVEDVYYEQPLNAVPVDGGTENILDYTPDAAPAGYRFGGWCLSGEDLEKGEVIPEESIMPAGDLTLYALWVPLDCTVTFDSRGGSEVEDQIVPAYGKAAVPEEPVRAGSEFAGWYTADGSRWSFDQQITENITLYALWRPELDPVRYTVKHVMKDTGEEIDSESLTGTVGASVAVFPIGVTNENYPERAYLVPDAPSKSIVLGTDAGENEAVFYYTVGYANSYRVSYLEKGTDRKLEDDKVVERTSLSYVTEMAEDIWGYTPEQTVLTAELTPGKEGQITFYYTSIAGDSVMVRPADLTIYMGGTPYDGTVIDEEGSLLTGNSDAGFPEPGFQVLLPADLQEAMDNDGASLTDLVFREKNGDKSWKFVPYDGNPDTAVYKLEPQGADQEPTRVQFTDPDTDAIVTSDAFQPGLHVNQTLEMSLYKGSVGDITVEYGGETCEVDSSPAADLTVRGTTAGEQYAAAAAEDGFVPAEGRPGLSVPEGTAYTINDSQVAVTDGDVALLFDDIINNKGGDREDLLVRRAEKELDDTGNTRNYEFKYLDLVDQNNGNVWVTASNNVTVYWPLPEGTGPDTEFTILHFEDLDREMSAGDIQAAVADCQVEEITPAGISDTHVSFSVEPGGFSPFALVWETEGGGTAEDNDPQGNIPGEDSPQTGDTAGVWGWIGLLAMSAAALIAVPVLGNRKRSCRKSAESVKK